MRFRLLLAAGVAAAVGVALAVSASVQAQPALGGRGHAAAAGIHKIKHVIVIMQENRSFDSYFGTFPGAAGIPEGVCLPDPRHGGCVKRQLTRAALFMIMKTFWSYQHKSLHDHKSSFFWPGREAHCFGGRPGNGRSTNGGILTVIKHVMTGAAAAFAALALAVPGTSSAASASTINQNISFFTGGGGDAHWLSSGHSAVTLGAPGNSSYAGFTVHHFPATLDPGTPASFTYTEAGSPSGGAPRLVITDAGGDQAVEYAYPVTADGTTVNVAGQWDIMNGPAGYHYNVGYAAAANYIDNDGGAVSEYLVSDSYTGAHSEVITGLTLNGQQLTG